MSNSIIQKEKNSTKITIWRLIERAYHLYLLGYTKNPDDSYGFFFT